MSTELESLQDKIKNELANLGNSVAPPSSNRISTRDKKFTLPDGTSHAGPLMAVVLDFRNFNRYFTKPYDPQNPTPPDCFAIAKDFNDLSPGNHPLTMAYANALQQSGQPHVAEEVLLEQSRRKPNDTGLWYLLAEVQGLSGNIVGLHRSRAEYFILKGNLDAAQRQLAYALKLVNDDFTTSALINERLGDVIEMRAALEAS